MLSSFPLVLLLDLTSTLHDPASDGPDARDIELTSPAAAAARIRSSPMQDGCPNDCPCRCHAPSRDVQLIPKALRPWLGRLNVPRTLLAASSSSVLPCDHAECARGRQQIQKIKYTVPGWFLQVEATLRCEAFPIHFCIQTPRTVSSLRFLWYISFDEFKMKLSTRELTLCDVEPNGLSVLHVSPRHSHTARTLVS